MSETSKTPNFDEWKESSDGILDEAVAKDLAALEARHAEEMRVLTLERDRAIELMNMIDRGHPDVEEFNQQLREKAGKR